MNNTEMQCLAPRTGSQNHCRGNDKGAVFSGFSAFLFAILGTIPGTEAGSDLVARGHPDHTTREGRTYPVGSITPSAQAKLRGQLLACISLGIQNTRDSGTPQSPGVTFPD